MNAIELCDVHRSYYRGPSVLRGFSMQVQEGSAVALIGQSGTGKSTVLRLISGLDRPQHGSVKYGLRTGWIIPSHAFFSYYSSCAANIRFAARYYGIDEMIYLRDVREMSELGSLIDQKLDKLSILQRGQLATAMGLCLDADAYLFDEYAGYGSDPFREKCGEVIRGMIYHGRAVVIASSIANVVLPFCTEAYLIDDGHARHFADLAEGLSYLAAMPQRSAQPIDRVTQNSMEPASGGGI